MLGAGPGLTVARLRRRVASSIRQSNGLLIRRFRVRFPGGPPLTCTFAEVQLRTCVCVQQKYNKRAVLIYAGDLDPSGEDIEREFVERVDLFDEVRRVALKIEQLYDDDADYLMFAGNPQGHHAEEFAQKYLDMLPELPPDHPVTEKIDELDGLFQVEINAMDNDLLRSLFEEALKEFWNDGACHARPGARGRGA